MRSSTESKETKMRCIVIGATSLPLRCAEIWLREGNLVSAIVSNDEEFLAWAKRLQIPSYQSIESLLAGVEKFSFDYLFSIANEFVLGEQILALPRRLAINYHDAPLPRYAGNHATSWALINGERTHGIVWHLMTEKVDAGDVLKREKVEITATDTALTLNTKCYEAAIRGFAELVGELAQERFVAEKQDSAQRTFYGRYKRPFIGGTINWERSAEEISRMVRGLEFGEHENPLGTCKMLIGSEFFIVRKIEITDTESNGRSGTIDRIGEDSLEIASSDKNVIVKELLALDGEAVAVEDLVRRYGLSEGKRLASLTELAGAQTAELYAQSAKEEKFWVDRISSLETIRAPYSDRIAQSDPADYARFPLDLPEGIADSFSGKIDFANRVLPAVFGILLSRLGNTERFDIGYLDAVRNFPPNEFPSLFALHKPLKIEIDTSRNFNEFLSDFEKELGALRSRSPYPKDIFWRYPQLRGKTDHQYDFPVVYANVERIGDFSPAPGMELALVAAEEEADYVWVYDKNRIETENIGRLSEHLAILLDGIIAGEKTEIAKLPLLSEAERRRILVDWNDNRAEYPSEEGIHRLFEGQATKTPEAIALIDGDNRISYRELNERANQAAHYLQESGVEPGSLVGICAERSAEMIVGVLAILKAGAGYVPLDPSFPKERLKFIVDDTKLAIVVTQEKFAQQWQDECEIVISLDSPEVRYSGKDRENPRCLIQKNSPAYVTYTSGSTGRPKGVLVSHKSLVNHAVGISRIYDLRPTDRILQFATFTFDVAAEELFPSLANGASVVLLPETIRGSVRQFTEFLEKEEITVVNLPVSFWREWVHSLNKSGIQLNRQLRLCVAGSEKILPEDYNKWRKLASGGVRWLNAFGLAETTITSIVFDPYRSFGDSDLDTMPIGRPISNTEAYVLDKQLRPVPVGIPGELFIGGDCLALGYLNRPELTTERFVANPFDPKPEARLYKTGDLVRYLPNGDLEHIERVDNQVKIRGFRVEIGEIEAVLAAHNGLRDAAVIALDNDLGEKGLVAYLVPDAEKPVGGESPVELWPSIGEYPVYDELAYYAMSTDKGRTSRYRAAIGQLVKDKTVVEIGTGSDLVLARFCVAAGAKKVYAIEAIEESYRSAEALMLSLNLSDRIVLIKGFSSDVELPEKVDVCVSEIIGTIGSSEGVVPVLNDARRFLKDDGRMIPERCLTKIAAVQLPDSILESPHFSELPAKYTEKVFREVGHKFDVRVCLKNLPKENFLSDDGVFEDLSFTKEITPEYSSEITLNFVKSGRVDGFLLWLNLYADQNAVIDNIREESSWLPVYFPIFEPGIEAREGDFISATCLTSISDNGFNPDYRIKGALHKKSGEIIEFEHRSYHHEPVFRQTPFYQRLFNDGEISVKSSAKNSPSVQEIRRYLSERLPRYMIPTAFVEIPELPLMANGKIDRKRLPDPGKVPMIAVENYEAGHDETERQLIAIWEEILGVKPIGVRDDFFELGGHSLKAIRMFGEVEEKFGKSIPIATLFQAGTIEKLAEILRQEGWSEPESSIVPIQPKGTKPPFFCIHARGGNVLFYRDLARYLGEDQPFYGIQARRLGGRQVGHATVEEMAAFYIQEMRSKQAEGPYYLGGASFGGLAAFEMARQLKEAGEEVGLLALFDTGTPDYPKLLPGTTRWQLKFYMAWRRIELHRDNLKAFNWTERKGYVKEKLDKLKLKYWRKIRNWRMNAMRKYHLRVKGSEIVPVNYIQIEDQIGRAGENYKPQRIDGKMTLYRATSQPLGIVEDETLGWREYVSGGIEIHDVPGHHGSIVAEPSVRILAEKLRECLDESHDNFRQGSPGKTSSGRNRIPETVSLGGMQALLPWFLDLTSFIPLV